MQNGESRIKDLVLCSCKFPKSDLTDVLGGLTCLCDQTALLEISESGIALSVCLKGSAKM